MNRRLPLYLPFVSSLSLLWAQAPLLQVDGGMPRDWLGHSVRPAGDVDGDGVADYVVGASQNENLAHSPFPGYALVISGADSSVLHTFVGDGTNWTDGPDDHLGASVDGAGDVNGDGFADIIAGAYKDDNGGLQNAGMVRVYSGADGAILYQIDGEQPGDRLGISVRRLGDVNGDGRPDQLIGIYKDDTLATNSGAVRVIDGTNGATLYHVHCEVASAAFGWNVAPVGDVNGDEIPDFIAGAPRWPQPFAGFARVLSGADGSTLHEVQGDAEFDLFGWAVAGVGDLDGDGVPDFGVGAPQHNLAQATGAGYAKFYSGADASLLLTVVGDFVADGFGSSLDGAGDVNGDGQADVIVGAPRFRDLADLGEGGYVRVFSGADATILQQLRGDVSGDLFGWSVAGGFDHDGDGASDLLIGCPEEILENEGAGYAQIHAALCNPPVERYCIGAPNSVGDGATITLEGSLSFELDNARLVAIGLPVFHFGLFYYGPDQVQVPFGDGFRCVGGQVNRMDIVSTDAGGRLEQAVQATETAGWIPGTRWNVQLWYRDPFAFQSGWNLSDALGLTICP